MSEKIEIVHVDKVELMEIAWDIRHSVFTKEQGIPAELDKDGEDKHALNILLYVDGRVAGTGRMVIENKKGVLARIAVLREFRGRGYASEIVRALERYGVEQGVTKFELYPHRYLESFYNRLGYISDPDYSSNVAGHALIRMSKEVTQ
ncbi:putative acetyltransferase [Fulvivirga imtechensis AK7]|uniref:Putative acetyltransferase n=1 Tax=Fulvivirga imtechensis AK7 TaxID=1237149 RepID=L8JRI4_9BACT|nr:GNAT family N-acetyltransferase [Fulvivirga imtechensis]ELR71591.1 putative acetyltransferase [Fulvivirga imtechensis AK7]